MHRGCFVWTLTPPLLGRRTPRSGPVCVCVCVPLLPGRVDRPPGRVLVRLTIFCGRSRCSLCQLCRLRAGIAVLVLLLCGQLVSTTVTATVDNIPVLYVCVLACACCLFPAAKTTAKPVNMFSLSFGFLLKKKCKNDTQPTHPCAARICSLSAAYVLPAVGQALQSLSATAMMAMLWVLLPVVLLKFAAG